MSSVKVHGVIVLESRLESSTSEEVSWDGLAMYFGGLWWLLDQLFQACPIGYESPWGDPEHAHETQNTLESLFQLAWEHDLDQW